MNAVEIDRCKNVGITALIRVWMSYTPFQQKTLHTAGFITKEEDYTINYPNGYFEVLIPLSMIFGFAEDYRKIVINMKHELILTSIEDRFKCRDTKKGGW